MIAVVGEALFDAHVDGDEFRLFSGRCPFNIAVALARLGVPFCYLPEASLNDVQARLRPHCRECLAWRLRHGRPEIRTPLVLLAAITVRPAKKTKSSIYRGFLWTGQGSNLRP